MQRCGCSPGHQRRTPRYRDELSWPRRAALSVGERPVLLPKADFNDAPPFFFLRRRMARLGAGSEELVNRGALWGITFSIESGFQDRRIHPRWVAIASQKSRTIRPPFTGHRQHNSHRQSGGITGLSLRTHTRRWHRGASRHGSTHRCLQRCCGCDLNVK